MIESLVQEREGCHVVEPFLKFGVLALFSERRWKIRHDQPEDGQAQDEKEALCRLNGIPYDQLVYLKQVHGFNIVRFDDADETAGNPPKPNRQIDNCDAIITRKAGIPIAIHTADCAPLFFLDTENKAVGLAHIGWKGAVHGLISKMVQAMKAQFLSKAENLHVAIGPMIRRCCYEVGDEFQQMFGTFVFQDHGKYFCDLAGYIYQELKSEGILEPNIIDTAICTSCENHRFFSYRKEGDQADRICSVMMIQEGGQTF